MAAPNVEKYVEELFRGSSVKMEVISDLPTLEKEYPLFAAVNRCASRKNVQLITFKYTQTKTGFVYIKQRFLVMLGVSSIYDTKGKDLSKRPFI